MAQAGAEFAEFVLQAAFGSKKSKTVQAYVDLSAESGGEGIKKEIGSDLGYFSVNITLGVSALPVRGSKVLNTSAGWWYREDPPNWLHRRR